MVPNSRTRMQRAHPQTQVVNYKDIAISCKCQAERRSCDSTCNNVCLQCPAVAQNIHYLIPLNPSPAGTWRAANSGNSYGDAVAVNGVPLAQSDPLPPQAASNSPQPLDWFGGRASFDFVYHYQQVFKACSCLHPRLAFPADAQTPEFLIEILGFENSTATAQESAFVQGVCLTDCWPVRRYRHTDSRATKVMMQRSTRGLTRLPPSSIRNLSAGLWTDIPFSAHTHTAGSLRCWLTDLWLAMRAGGPRAMARGR